MNTKFYNQLLNHAQRLICKYPFLPLNKVDLVHENWDFKTEDKKIIQNKITRYFYDELTHHHIPFSVFKNNNGEDLPIEMIGTKRRESIALKQCSKCQQIMPTGRFPVDRKVCQKCIDKKHYSKHREKLIKKAKLYSKTEKGREIRKLAKIRFAEKYKEQERNRKLLSYYKHKEKILLKRKLMRKLGIWKEDKIKVHERYLKYRNKMLLKKAMAVRQ